MTCREPTCIFTRSHFLRRLPLNLALSSVPTNVMSEGGLNRAANPEKSKIRETNKFR